MLFTPCFVLGVALSKARKGSEAQKWRMSFSMVVLLADGGSMYLPWSRGILSASPAFRRLPCGWSLSGSTAFLSWASLSGRQVSSGGRPRTTATCSPEQAGQVSSRQLPQKKRLDRRKTRTSIPSRDSCPVSSAFSFFFFSYWGFLACGLIYLLDFKVPF